MATTITLTLRCQSKNLVSGPDGSPLMNISLQTVMDPGTPPAPYSALTTTIPVPDDTFIFGNLYTITVTDEAPPTKPRHHAADCPLHIPSFHDAGIEVEVDTNFLSGPGPFITLDPKLLQPGNLQISGSAADPIVTIHHDGHVELNPKYTLDEAARAFWDTVIKLNPNANGDPKEKA